MSERVYCLYRVSTMKQVDYDETNQADIPMQRNACHAFAEKMGWTIVHEEQETGISGFKVSAAERDKLQLIKEHASQGKFDILLVFMFDRIGRKADESPFVVEWFFRNGIRVWSVQEGEQRFDNHVDTLLNYIRFWQADGESRKTSIRTKEGLRQLVLSGGYRGGGVPYGYCLETTGKFNKRKHEISKLVINDDEATVVRKIFDMYICRGYGRLRIATELNRQGVKNRKNENWHEATIGHMLHNITYTGILHSGDAVSSVSEELIIINRKMFDRAQTMLVERTNESAYERTLPRNTRGQSLLSGNVFCGHCGGRLTLTTNGTVTRLANGETKYIKRIRYVCYRKTRKRCECDGQTGYTAHILDELVCGMVKQILDQLGSIDERALINGLRIRSEADLHQKIRLASQELRAAEQEYDLLKPEIMKSLRGESGFPIELLSQMSREAEEKVQSAASRLEGFRSELALSKKQSTNTFWPSCNLKWSDLFEQSDLEVKKMIACYLIKQIHVFRGYALCLEVNDLGGPVSCNTL